MATKPASKPRAKPKAKTPTKAKATTSKKAETKNTTARHTTRPTGAGTNQNRRARGQQGFQGSGGNPDAPQIHPRVKASTLKKIDAFAKKRKVKRNAAVSILLDHAVKSPPKA